MEKVVPRWRTGEAQMRDNPGDELNPAEGVRRRCKKFQFINILSNFKICVCKVNKHKTYNKNK